ncbi:MAG: ribonuclease HII [Lachnospiraceae bacterium]|nr:ribonuclease HII [Lachnospiraceae bacterium]
MTEKQEIKRRAELERLDAMKQFEREYASHGVICGIDEAGRGPLAGPVVAAAVILPLDHDFLYLNDSKKVTEKRREVLFDEIREYAIGYGIGMASPEEIDEINILQADYLAMKRALAQLPVMPDVLLNDAVIIPGVTGEQVSIIKGDAKSVSIAAASILAKVTRDRIMVSYDDMYPEYGFAKHKGYGTKQHSDAIRAYGPCPIHRKSFLKNFRE